MLNGGFNQYFCNGYGLFGYLTLASLKLVNANFTMGLLNNAIRIVNIEGFNEDEYRRKIYKGEFDELYDDNSRTSKILDEYDDEYYEMKEDLIELMGEYLRNVS